MFFSFYSPCSSHQRGSDVVLEQVGERGRDGVDEGVGSAVAAPVLQEVDLRNHPGRRKVGGRNKDLEVWSRDRREDRTNHRKSSAHAQKRRFLFC